MCRYRGFGDERREREGETNSSTNSTVSVSCLPTILAALSLTSSANSSSSIYRSSLYAIYLAPNSSSRCTRVSHPARTTSYTSSTSPASVSPRGLTALTVLVDPFPRVLMMTAARCFSFSMKSASAAKSTSIAMSSPKSARSVYRNVSTTSSTAGVQSSVMICRCGVGCASRKADENMVRKYSERSSIARCAG